MLGSRLYGELIAVRLEKVGVESDTGSKRRIEVGQVNRRVEIGERVGRKKGEENDERMAGI